MVTVKAKQPCKIVPIIDGNRVTFDFTHELKQDVNANALDVLLNTGLIETFKEDNKKKDNK